MYRERLRRTVFVLVMMGAASCVVAAQNPAPADTQAIFNRIQPLAKMGSASAQYNLGVIYDRGYGVKRDYAKARAWYKKAAAQGYARAAHNLGIMYQKGHGVLVDNKRAAYWFERAANAGEPAAQNNLAVMYARGIGIEKNMQLAAYWTARAAQAGNPSAQSNMPLIVARLPRAVLDADDVNIRAQPDMHSNVLQQSDAGTRVVVVRRDDEWSQVLFPAVYKLGWVSNSLLQTDPEAADQTLMLARAQRRAPVAEDVSVAAPAVETVAAPVAARQTSLSAEPQEIQPVASTGREDSAVTPAAGSDAGSSALVATTPPATQAQDVERDAPTAAAPVMVHKIVATDALNVRRAPSRQAVVLFQLHRGDRVTVIESYNGWKHIEIANGRTGWVAGFLLIDA